MAEPIPRVPPPPAATGGATTTATAVKRRKKRIFKSPEQRKEYKSKIMRDVMGELKKNYPDYFTELGRLLQSSRQNLPYAQQVSTEMSRLLREKWAKVREELEKQQEKK